MRVQHALFLPQRRPHIALAVWNVICAGRMTISADGQYRLHLVPRRKGVEYVSRTVQFRHGDTMRPPVIAAFKIIVGNDVNKV